MGKELKLTEAQISYKQNEDNNFFSGLQSKDQEKYNI